MNNNSVSIIIPCWNSESQLKQNLPAVLIAAKKVSAEIIIVDDDSNQDNSKLYLSTLKGVKYLQNSTNQGFTKTVNRGVGEATGEIIVLLNTDVAPEPDCFVQALTYFADPHVFAITFNSGEGWAEGRWEDGMLVHYPIRKNAIKPMPSLWASGGQAAFRRNIWQQLGGLDPLYAPFYWEDVDLGYRAWKAGYQILWVPDARCSHHHESSVIKNNFSSSYISRIALRNQLLFIWKNITDPALLGSHLARLPRLLYRYPTAVLSAIPSLPKVVAGRKGRSKLTDTAVLNIWSTNQ